MRFEVGMPYTQADFVGLRKAWRRMNKTLHALHALSRACFLFVGGALAVVGGIGLAHCVLALFRGDFATIVSILPFSLGFAVAAVLLFVDSDDKRWGKRMWKHYCHKGDTITYRFYDDCFTEHTPSSDHRFHYSTIVRILEDDERYYLFVDKSAAHVLRKSAFTVGDSAQFAAFLAARIAQQQ